MIGIIMHIIPYQHCLSVRLDSFCMRLSPFRIYLLPVTFVSHPGGF